MRIKELRELYDVQQKALANILGISSNTLSQYENGKREPGIDVVSKIAKHFNVTTDYVYGIDRCAVCHDCGLSYCPDVELDRETHAEIHSKWLKAKEKYGFCYANHGENEHKKVIARNIVKDFSLPINERYDAQIEVFRCLFSRSLQSLNYSEEHIDFETYIAMLLNQDSIQAKIGDELYAMLVDEYGKKEGFNGTYYIPERKEPTTIAAHFDGSEFTEEELDEIRNFAEFVKNKRK